MTFLRNWADRVAAFAGHIAAALLLSMFIIFILQIVLRYIVSDFIGMQVKIDWTVEWVTIAWLWGILGSFAFVIRSSDMIRLDILYAAAPRSLQRAMDVFVGVTVAAIFAYTLPHAWDYVTFMEIERTAAFRWRFDIVFAIYIPFHIAVIVRMLMQAWDGLTGRRDPEAHALTPETHDYD